MTHAQQLLRDAAANICRAAVWLDPRPGRPERTEEALKLIYDTRLMLESVEMTLGLNQAMREEVLREGSR